MYCCVTILDFADSDAGKTWVGDIKQGATCNLTINGNNLPDDWYYDSDWFQKEEDGSYTFKAIKLADILFWQTSPISHSASGQ